MTELGKRPRALVWLLAITLSLVVAHLLDGWATGFRLPDVYEKDWGRLLRVMGFAPTWLLIAVAISLQESAGRQRDPKTRSTWHVMVIAMIVGGLGSEVLKLLIRRERPGDSGDYQFRSFAEDPFSTRGLGMPSGHTMVAFTGAAAIGRRFPRAAPVLYGLAVGCGATRILAHAHFLSDVTAAAIGGTLAGRWAARPIEKQEQPT